MATPQPRSNQLSGLRLAFVAALQLLPPRQRAVLVLREVLEFPALDVANALGVSVASVNSSLQRARATLRSAHLTVESLREPADPEERAVVERYLDAFVAADLDGLTQLLAGDVVLEMPPVSLWMKGRAHYRRFMERVFAMRGTDWQVLSVQANGRPALAAYAPDRESGRARAHSIQLFDVAAGQVRLCVTFVEPQLFELFGLPMFVALTGDLA